ncbi:rhodanese-related sulfurtransferase [Synechococcales cyanobacterium C]|uniref:Rhodanese-related sulfurtransferase n=1 Tax=Petrachloros mirabilis ULC683 TaxID=2781853 RepID=A0A8K1ZYI6_9CYAN|nr:rhodanese-like domain-containing protein [Petrachloros mirabilis]NCJ07514.1 rhodanese-related sulfurtransferase [Petrachloros mirabilis ULC683]
MTTLRSDSIPELSVESLAHILASLDHPTQLVDVREASELDLVQLPGFMHLPLSQFPVWSETIHAQLDAQTRTIVICHHGMRSAQMCAWLIQQGFTQVENVIGGIDAYALRVDASLPRY